MNDRQDNSSTGNGSFAPSSSSVPVLLGAAVLAFVTPTLVFTVVGLFEGMGIPGVASSVAEQFSTDRQNLAMVGTLGVLPVVLLSLTVWIIGLIRRIRTSRRSFAVGGASCILLVLVWVNVSFWPTYLPDKAFAGFPHGLEFVIGPFIFAPVAMLVGLIAAALVGR